MPVSRTNHLSWLGSYIIDTQPKSILDIGIGFGLMGMFFRALTDVWNGKYENWETRIDGIEIFEKYIGELQKKIYTNIYIGNVLDIIDTLPDYDFIYMGDVIEHLTGEDGKILLEKLKKKGKVVMVVTPLNVSKQGEINGNKNESHISQWTERDFIDAEINTFGNVLTATFDNQIFVYYCEAMKTFGEKLKMERYDLKDINKKVFFQGLYFDEDYEVFKNHKGTKIVFWNGSDVLRLLNSQERIQIIKQFKASHFCHNKQLKDELASVGIEAIIKPMFFGDINKYPISYKQSNNPQVYMTCNQHRENEYGVPLILEIAKEFSKIKFHIYGVDGQNIENVVYHGWIEEGQMDNEIKDFQAVIRCNKHDGFSQTVMKSILMGQHPIVSSSKEEIIKQLKELGNKKEPNQLREEFIKSL